MNPIPFVTLAEPRYGEMVRVSPLVARIIAPNASKFTYHGTGTYVVGAGTEVAVIDPGPLNDAHRDSLAAALVGRRVTAIVVTHCHADHSPLAAWLAAETGAPTVAFGPHPLLDDPDADDLVTAEPEHAGGEAPDAAGPAAGAATDDGAAPAAGAATVEESTDYAFEPVHRVVDGDIAASGPGWTLRAVHTPGHTSNHMCYALAEEDALFTGDHIMGWSTTVIAPPDGDMRAYFASLHKVIGRHDGVLLPTHGAPITEPGPFLDAFLAHRLDREAQVLGAVRGGETSIPAMVKVLYANVREELHKPAGRSVLAHLVKLVDDGLVAVDDTARPTLKAVYRPV